VKGAEKGQSKGEDSAGDVDRGRGEDNDDGGGEDIGIRSIYSSI
jgi:hypothetical protein